MIYMLKVLNPSLTTVATIFDFISCIWTTQYYAAGEFELVVEYSEEMMTALSAGNYVVKNNTNQIAVIERVRYDYKPDEGGTITASGRLAISVLDRRLIASYTNYHPNIYTYCANNGNMEDAARSTVNALTITPFSGGAERIIANLALGTDHGYTETAKKRISSYRNLYTALTSFLATKYLAHKIVYNSSTNKLNYEVYKGVDRSSTMVFSRNLENLLSFSYELDKTEYKNWILIGGEGEGTQRFVTSTNANGYTAGTERREYFYDAQSDKEDGVTNADYAALLKSEARQECRELAVQKSVEAEIDLVNSGFEFGKDYFVGDTILIRDIIDFKPRITTVIESQSADGYTIDVEFNEDAPEEEEE